MSLDADELADDEIFVRCNNCETVVTLIFESSGRLLLRCECPHTVVEISEAIQDRSVFDPLSGKWSVLDEDP